MNALRASTRTLAVAAVGASVGVAVSSSDAKMNVLLLLGSLAVMVVAITHTVLLRDISVSLCIFAAWVLLEDLVRKYSGNDIRLFFVKDLILAGVYFSFYRGKRWQRYVLVAFREGKFETLAVLAVGTVGIAVAAVTNAAVGVAGWRLYFLYIGLLPIGVAIGTAPEKLASFLRLASLLLSTICVIGIIQMLFPAFLTPTSELGGQLYRNLPGRSDLQVFRPTGPFIDAGRFAAAAVLSVAVAYFRLLRYGGRLAIAAVAISTTAALLSGSKGAAIQASFIIACGLLAGRRHQAVTAALAACALLAALAAPPSLDLVADRVELYRATLDPNSRHNEWDFRIQQYFGQLPASLASGGLLGRGTGTESLSLKYLGAGVGSYRFEAGYASIAAEWGAIGLLVWCRWTFVWLRRMARMSMRFRPLAPLAAWIFVTLVLGFLGGLQSFQNYITNAFFWLLSGIIVAVGRVSAATYRGEMRRVSV